MRSNGWRIKLFQPRHSRDAPETETKASAGFLCSPEAWTILCGDGYKPVTECPEVQMCAGVYADLIASMTIHLMENAEQGDVRIKDELAKKLDISPNRDMTRSTFMSLLVSTLILHGNQVTIPSYNGTLLENLTPVPPSMTSFVPDGNSYRIVVNGREYSPDEVLHFPLRPDPEQPWRGQGFQVPLRGIVKSLRQTNATKEAIMKSPTPSIIVKVDGLTEEFASKEGRKKLREQYLDASEAGQPWMIPAEAFSVEQVKPLTLNDLAIKTGLELDKKAVAAMMGVPPFLVGVGDFKRDEFNWFVSTRVMAVAKIIEQELTKKLLYSPRLYWRFNYRSLLNYDIGELVNAGKEMVDRMALRRNEWRDWLGFAPDPEMDELLALENYIPADRLGDQGKLVGGGESDAERAADPGRADEV